MRVGRILSSDRRTSYQIRRVAAQSFVPDAAQLLADVADRGTPAQTDPDFVKALVLLETSIGSADAASIAAVLQTAVDAITTESPTAALTCRRRR